LGSSLKKLLIFDVVRPLPRRPINLAGSKYGTVANTIPDSSFEQFAARKDTPQSP
jgi:hypothetical protein